MAAGLCQRLIEVCLCAVLSFPASKAKACYTLVNRY
jgi:hypothetical protein